MGYPVKVATLGVMELWQHGDKWWIEGPAWTASGAHPYRVRRVRNPVAIAECMERRGGAVYCQHMRAQIAALILRRSAEEALHHGP